MVYKLQRCKKVVELENGFGIKTLDKRKRKIKEEAKEKMNENLKKLKKKTI